MQNSARQSGRLNTTGIHLVDMHQKDLVVRLPLHGKSFGPEYRAEFAIDMMKQKTPQVFYDHKTTKFVPPPDRKD